MALFQTKGHWAVTERVSEEKMVQNASGWQHINLGKHQNVLYIHVRLYLSQINSTTKLVFKKLSVFEILLILENVIY